MTGQVVHFEVPADDLDRAREFYRAAFGWELTPMPEVDYTIAMTTPADESGRPKEPGAINGGMFTRDDARPGPIITLDVPDVDAALATVEQLGGSTVLPKTEVMGMGYAAYFRDTEGNVMGLWQSAAG
ncbi:VOC family protein [Jiangella mangrovi]|uniref:Putative enzyme related to lactoylglutathione lyase n=1 Tax=Jiangella mangrovi TaxID=1524084 RepID=A0A7W9GWM8_9ACTN|nr:putative enzyme related to lactoylglutathione lyase [Jiangella mangrovi]